ncbi:MAG: CRTAC1 family protein [Bryobacterales bacterium]|nr:CRTAC1 family protein [Bryobacterales bacterium]
MRIAIVFAVAAAAFAQIRFDVRPLPFVLENGASGDFRLIELMTGGVAVLDFDSDGCLDIYFANGAAIPSLKKAAKHANRLYRGDCKLEFTDVTESAGVAGEGYSMGVAAADYDADGHTDLFVAGVNRNLLYRNLGGGKFREVSHEAGLADATKKPWSVGAGWFDYNNDGHADLFVVNYLDWNLATEPRCGSDRARFYCHPNAFQGLANQLYRNNGDGTFTDVSKQSGIASHIGKGMGVAFADFDADGFADAYVANDSMRAFLFRNHGDGTFREIGLEAGVALRDDGAPIAGMGVDFRDYDNDGHPDLAVTGMINDTFLLFRNVGKQWQFEDDRARTGLLLATRQLTGWGVGLIDFDNDGWKDLFAALSHFPRLERYTGRASELPCRVFRNVEGKRFTPSDVSTPAYYRGAAFGDFDNDGRVDAIVTAIGSQARLLRNTSDAGNWIAFRVQGTGALVRVTLADARTLTNHATTSVGYASASEALVRFGLGRATRATRVEVTWPGGAKRTLNDVEGGRIVEVARP